MNLLKTFQKKPTYFDAVQWDESVTTLNQLKKHGFPWSGHRGHRDSPDLAKDMRMKVGETTVPVLKGDWIYRERGRTVWGLIVPEEFTKNFDPS